MSLSLGRFRRGLFGISPAETSFSRRGFYIGDRAAREHLEFIGQIFLGGYHAGLEENTQEGLVLKLDGVEQAWRGFAYEGAAFALRFLDRLTPWRRDRWSVFFKGIAAPYLFLAYAGAGWVLAGSRQRVESVVAREHPVYGWSIVDGCGFYEGYFHRRRTIEAHVVPSRYVGYARRAFDQGVGRSLWFVQGATVSAITDTIATFPAERRPDLWSGIGLAASYAGGVQPETLEQLRAGADDYLENLAQGAVFAAKVRQHAGNPAPHTEAACQILAGLSAAEAVVIVDNALEGLPSDRPEPAYEVMRQRVRAHFRPLDIRFASPSPVLISTWQ